MKIYFRKPGGDPAGIVNWLVPALLSLSLVVAACSKSSSGSPTAPLSSDTTISFSSQVQPIFTQSCAIPGCHVTGGIAPMSLQTGKAYADIVNQQSVVDPSYVRVKPFDADSSYLYLKITGRVTPRMPLNRTPLDTAEIITIRSWINQGARNN